MKGSAGSAVVLVLALVTALVVTGVVGYVVVARGALPTGPTELVWDRTACHACRMHVGEPAFAAQIQLRDGRTLAFDDPGCLLLSLDALRGDAHAIWFHHLREPRWLRSDAVGFVAVEPTPMGFGLGAVDVGAEGAIPLAEARARIAGIQSPRADAHVRPQEER
ncbi:MAG: hypothetical protein IPM29_07040 [Planctomycetes bacterium]|nr:hypothetical protein [Planctomycetota bacterium]